MSTAEADDLLRAWARRCRTSPETIAHVLVHQVWQGDETYADAAIVRAVEDALRNLPKAVAIRIDRDTAQRTVGTEMSHLEGTPD